MLASNYGYETKMRAVEGTVMSVLQWRMMTTDFLLLLLLLLLLPPSSAFCLTLYDL
jgi:hypothetical protein